MVKIVILIITIILVVVVVVVVDSRHYKYVYSGTRTNYDSKIRKILVILTIKN
jgi:hypothetical protein